MSFLYRHRQLIIILLLTFIFVILSRLSIYLFVYVKYRNQPFIKFDLYFVANYFKGFDSDYYKAISMNGYTYQKVYGFFPLFPLVIRYIKLIFFNHVLGFDAVSLIVNTIFLFITCVFSYKYVMLTRDNEKMAILSIILLTFGPWSYLSFQAMSESLFMMLLIMAMYSLKKGYYLRMGICGALLSATKAIGVFFVLVVLVEIIQKYFNENKHRSFIDFIKYCVHKPLLLLGVALIPIGLFSLIIYFQIKMHDGLIYFHTQKYLFNHVYFGYFNTLFAKYSINELPFVLFAGLITLSLIAHKKFSEAVLPIICYLVIGYSMLAGLPRYFFSFFTIMYGFLDLFKYDNKPLHKIELYGSVIIASLLEFILVYNFLNNVVI